MTGKQRKTLARCYVAIAEMDYDLAQWRTELTMANARIDAAYHSWQWLSYARRR